MERLDRRERGILAAFALLRVVAVLGIPTARFPDTPGYEQAPSFVGAAARPWTVPLLYTLVPVDSLRMLAQVVVAIGCWGWFAVALSRRFDGPVRTATMVGVLLLGVTQRATGWDTAMLTESLAVSLTVALLAAALTVDRKWGPHTLVAVFTLWTFTRDSHVYLAVLAVAVLAVAWHHHRRAVIACALVVVWAWAAGMNNTWTEGFNVASNIAYHHDDPEWFYERGMPGSDIFDAPAGADRQDIAWDDPTLRRWARDEGSATYTEFLVTHPGFTMSGLRSLPDMFDGDDGLSESRQLLPGFVERILWPMHGIPWMLPAAVVAALVAVRRSRSGLGWPLCLLLSTIPHALLVFHGSPIELGRHGLLLGQVVAVGSLWLAGWATSALVAERASDAPGEVVARRGSIPSGSTRPEPVPIAPPIAPLGNESG